MYIYVCIYTDIHVYIYIYIYTYVYIIYMYIYVYVYYFCIVVWFFWWRPALGEHKPGRIKPGRIKRAALSLQNQKYYICCFLLGETSQHKATTGSPNFHGALGAHPNSEKERDEYTTGIYIHGLTGMGKSTEVQKTLKGKDVNLLRDSPPPTRATQRAGVFLFFVIFVSISFSELRQQPSFGSGSQRN